MFGKAGNGTPFLLALAVIATSLGTLPSAQAQISGHCVSGGDGVTPCDDGSRGGTSSGFGSNGSDDSGAWCRGGWLHGPLFETLFPCPPQNGSPAPSPASGSIFPDSSTRLLTPNDLANLSSWQLKVARNEIYARKGRYFETPELRDYFDKMSWYHPYRADVPASDLNAVERANISTIQKAEARVNVTVSQNACGECRRFGLAGLGNAARSSAKVRDYLVGALAKWATCADKNKCSFDPIARAAANCNSGGFSDDGVRSCLDRVVKSQEAGR
jgi:YARHG domain